MSKFKLTESHIKLLKNANVGWVDCEFGAPSIDCKRPFGNGNVYGDIANILGFPEGDDEDKPYPDSLIEYMGMVYKQLETALSVVLTSQTFEPGEYVSDNYGGSWRKA